MVYIVEDDEAARHSAQALLDTMGYEVRTFDSCEGFLKEVRDHHAGFLLLDYRFDGISGLELLKRLRERNVFMPTIIYTGVFDAGIKRRARAFDEVVAVLHKPASGHSLRCALRNAEALQQSRANGLA